MSTFEAFKAHLDFKSHRCQWQQETEGLVMSPTRRSITDINRTLDKLNEMSVGLILLCHYLGDKACLQKDIGTSWILVEGVELATVDTQLT